MERFGAGACKVERLARVPSAQDGVPRCPQDVCGKGEDLGLVIDNEDRFGWLRR
jgi:hypothetical protein